MNWVDKLINSVTSKKEPETIQVTFKGSGYMSPIDSANWQAGWKGGLIYYIENCEIEPDGKTFLYNSIRDKGLIAGYEKYGGKYGDGFAEGCIYCNEKQYDFLVNKLNSL